MLKTPKYVLSIYLEPCGSTRSLSVLEAPKQVSSTYLEPLAA